MILSQKQIFTGQGDFMPKRKKIYKVYAVNPLWDLPELDFQCNEYSLQSARDMRTKLQGCGFKRVCFKRRRLQ